MHLFAAVSAGRGRPGRVLAVLVAGGLVLAACGASSSPGTTTGAPTTTSSTSTPSTSTPASPAATKAAIEHAYSVLFDLANPAVAPKLAVVQDGSQLSAAFQAAIASSLAKKAGGAKVATSQVLSATGCRNELLPSPCAKVDYSILAPGGSVLLAGSTGFAIESSGTWKVAKVTICTLLELESGGTVPPHC